MEGCSCNPGTLQPPQLQEGGRRSPQEPSEGVWPCQDLGLGLLAPELREKTFLLF